MVSVENSWNRTKTETLNWLALMELSIVLAWNIHRHHINIHLFAHSTSVLVLFPSPLPISSLFTPCVSLCFWYSHLIIYLHETNSSKDILDREYVHSIKTSWRIYEVRLSTEFAIQMLNDRFSFLIVCGFAKWFAMTLKQKCSCGCFCRCRSRINNAQMWMQRYFNLDKKNHGKISHENILKWSWTEFYVPH